jgi:hypothetical protein
VSLDREREGRCGTSGGVESASRPSGTRGSGHPTPPAGTLDPVEVADRDAVDRSRAVETGASVTPTARVERAMALDEFDAEGVRRMDDDEMTRFLSSQHVGVLSLPTDGAPAMRPLSFWFDGDESVYFSYVGAGSRKAALSDRAEAARFLVYRAETRYNWRSVILTGTIAEVPASEAVAVAEEMDLGRRPDAFERAGEAAETTLYRFAVTEWTGVSHVGLPPGFEADAEE